MFRRNPSSVAGWRGKNGGYTPALSSSVYVGLKKRERASGNTRETDTYRDRQTDRQAETETDSYRERQRDRKTDRERDEDRETEPASMAHRKRHTDRDRGTDRKIYFMLYLYVYARVCSKP